jgi:hypothetical protein
MDTAIFWLLPYGPKQVSIPYNYITVTNAHTQASASVTPLHRLQPHYCSPSSKNLLAALAPFSSRIGLVQPSNPSAKCTA